MTVWARSDIDSIAVSSDGHGGCGQTHKRIEGERFFSVTCPPCEEFLRRDKLWADTADAIPPTYDEERHRENLLRNRELNQASVLDQAAGLLALLAGPRDLLAGVSPALAPIAATCRKCSAAVTPTASFCGECGAPQLRQVESGAA